MVGRRLLRSRMLSATSRRLPLTEPSNGSSGSRRRGGAGHRVQDEVPSLLDTKVIGVTAVVPREKRMDGFGRIERMRKSAYERFWWLPRYPASTPGH